MEIDNTVALNTGFLVVGVLAVTSALSNPMQFYAFRCDRVTISQMIISSSFFISIPLLFRCLGRLAR
jgi:hypothetical protein